MDTVISLEQIAAEIEAILGIIGVGAIDSVPYDTAWVARLDTLFPKSGFENALQWLRRAQHEDGSWGGTPLHYHDRVICTLAAIIALRQAGQNSRDARRVERGTNYLWQEMGHLRQDMHDTIAFPVLILSLLNEARELGLDVPRDLYSDMTVVEAKLNKLSKSPQLWRNHTIFFSLEGAAWAIRDNPPNTNDFLQANGSVAASPAATAAVLLYSQSPAEQAVNYLQDVMKRQGDGGAPNVAPIDTFESAWSLNVLRRTGAISPDMPEVRRILKLLWAAWHPAKGLAYSSYSSVPDLDCTSTGFAVLKWGGYPVDPQVFASYEAADHFICYPEETDPSLSAHIRMLDALQMVKTHDKYAAWCGKIIALLRRLRLDGKLFADKWHISPYYLQCTAVFALQPTARDLAAPIIKWVTRTQRPDGGWGYEGFSTLEETAYCMQALLHWDRNVARINPELLKSAALYLSQHVHDEVLPPLWLGKCLYTPHQVIRATALAALFNYFKRE